MDADKIILVGDNPFHGISHLAQDRIKLRGNDVVNPDYAAKLVITSLENGADGFTFSVSETTLAILRRINETKSDNNLMLYAIVPYAYEYVRLATSVGGVPGLGIELAKQVMRSRNSKSFAYGLKGLATVNPPDLMKAYLVYEIYKIKTAAGPKTKLVSLLLHETVTDMALALNLDWVFKTHIEFMRDLGIKPGFETRNFPYLVKQFEKWGIGFPGTVIEASFNPLAFQMCPSREECEKALVKASSAEIIAFSILAAGRVKLPEAIDYIASLPELKGVAVGVSKISHCGETFGLLKEKLKLINSN
ncbi:MAG: hypothetical protein ABSG90_04860 [Dehalococcoidia bacterium]|jgi:hypothetical protein